MTTTFKVVCEGKGKPVQVIDTVTGHVLNGVIAVGFQVNPQGSLLQVVIEPGSLDLQGDDTIFNLVDPKSGKVRRVASVVWAADEKGQQEVWKPGQ